MGDATVDFYIFLCELGFFGLIAFEQSDIRSYGPREGHKSGPAWSRNMKRVERFFYWMVGCIVLSMGAFLAIEGATGFYLFVFLCGMLGCLLDMSATLLHHFRKRHKSDSERDRNTTMTQRSISWVSVLSSAIITVTLLSACVYLTVEEATGLALFTVLIVTLWCLLSMLETLTHYVWRRHKSGPVWYLNMTERQRSMGLGVAGIAGAFVCAYLAWF